MKASNLAISTVLILAIVAMVNLIVGEFSLRFDLTEGGQYTLSKATKDILADLQEPITVKAYFSEGLKPEIAKSRTDFRELLREYAELSDGMIVYEFLDPGENDELRNEALQAGIQPVTISVREKNEMSQQQAFMGALIQMGEESEVIPFIQPGAPLEYSLTTNIKKLSVLDKPSVGLIQGHGEPPINEMLQVSNSLSVLYSFEALPLNGEDPIPPRFKTLALVRPQDSIPPSHLQQLDGFLGRGGRLFIALNRVDGDMSNAYGTPVNTGLEGWLREKGVEVTDKFLIDASCGSVSVRQQMGVFQTVNQIKFPYIPVIQHFADHPITSGLEAAILPFASELQFTGDSSLSFTPIAFTSEQSGTQSTPVFFDIQKQWSAADFPRGNIPVAAILEGKLVGQTPSRIVVVGDGDFPVNGPRDQFQERQGDNISLMVNSIDWLSDDTGLIELRTKGVVSRPIDQLEEGTQNLLKYLNFLLPIILVLIYGYIRMQRKKITRIKRMEESYE